ncbi:MAG: hypothetical protein KJO31_13965 [Gammaproteobacteria bacterium]|nr:hypothetical protein [Gammaproteobacteria bacterium]
MKIAIALASLFLITNLAAHADEWQAMQERIERQMQVADRHQFDRRRDEARKPFATFRFLGLREGMVVLDVGAYAGYTTEMLSAAVGPSGKVYMQNREEVLREYADGYYDRTVAERLGNDRLPNVALHVREYDDIGLEGQVDMAFLGNLIHDFYYRDGEAQALTFLRSIRKALKPRGVLGVMDHVGVAGRDNGSLHRIEPGIVRGLLREAGFDIEAESGLFRNPDDDHSLMVYADEIYLETDRFLFQARKTDSN